jgi:hypothetical protein
MNRARLTLSALNSIILIMSLTACNNLGLLDQLENQEPQLQAVPKHLPLFLFATTNSFNGNIRSGIGNRPAGSRRAMLDNPSDFDVSR